MSPRSGTRTSSARPSWARRRRAESAARGRPDQADRRRHRRPPQGASGLEPRGRQAPQGVYVQRLRRGVGLHERGRPRGREHGPSPRVVQRLEPGHSGPHDPRRGRRQRARLRPRGADGRLRGQAPVTGRVAVVTGGTGALGQSVVLRFLRDGATVEVPWIVPEEWEALRSRAGDGAARLRGARVDGTDERAFVGFVADLLARHQRLDVLVNTVGGFAGGDLASTSLAEWRRMLDLNLTSAVIGCHAVLPAMRAARRGRIVNVASRAVVPPVGGFIAYTVSKSAVIALTQALAQEERPHGITVNAVLPSTMDTPANRRAMPDADRSGWVSTDAVAGVIAYLASDGAGAVSGAYIPV